ncbi:MAG: RICIN domain-containing protein [Clostridia bacterium]|nr:RICIN domain-containing protein [Clostridia bacterium]
MTSFNEAKYTKEEVKSLKEQTKEKIKSLQKNNTVDIAQNEDVIATNLIIEDHNREQIQSVSFAQSNVEYVGAFGKGTALRYVMTPGKINEEIVLEAYNGFKSYSVVIDTDGLTPVKTESGRVNLTDEKGETVVTIAAPFMYDSVEKHSFDVDVTVTRESKKSWRITYTPDKEWLTDEARVYPVVIDPTVSSSGTSNQSYDTYVSEEFYNDKHPDSTTLLVGYIGGYEYISYWSSELPTIPESTVISGASFNIKLSGATTTMGTIGIYTINSNWSEYVTWNTRPSIGATALDVEGIVPTNRWIRFSNSQFSNMIDDYLNYPTMTIELAVAYDDIFEDYNVLYSSESQYKPYVEIRYTQIYSLINHGLYYIRNAVDENCYLTIPNTAASTPGKIYNIPHYYLNARSTWNIHSVDPDSNNEEYTFSPMAARQLKLVWGPNQTPTLSNIDGEWAQWQFEACGDGAYYISSVAEPWMVLDGSLSSSSVYIFPFNGNENQKWVLEPVEELPEYGVKDFYLENGEEYWFKFHTNTMRVHSFETIGNIDTYGELYWDYLSDNSGVDVIGNINVSLNPLVSNDDSEINNENFYIECESDEAKVYYLRVTGSDEYQSGDCQIGVSMYPHSYGQSKKSWCWVAASKMVVEHNIGEISMLTKPIVDDAVSELNPYARGLNYDGQKTVDRIQHDTVAHIYQDNDDSGGDVSGDIQAMYYMAGENEITTTELGNNGLSNNEKDYIISEVASGRYVLVDIDSNIPNTTHAVVLTEYNSDNGKFTYFEPDYVEYIEVNCEYFLNSINWAVCCQRAEE